MAQKRIPRPRDPIALAKLIGDIATGKVVDSGDCNGPRASLKTYPASEGVARPTKPKITKRK